MLGVFVLAVFMLGVLVLGVVVATLGAVLSARGVAVSADRC
jgi:hypothetical protein